MEPCPADRTSLSRSGQSGSLGSNFRKCENRTVATSAIPIGIPGCPELACCTASIERARIAFASSLCETLIVELLILVGEAILEISIVELFW